MRQPGAGPATPPGLSSQPLRALRAFTRNIPSPAAPAAAYSYDFAQHRVASRDGASAQGHYLFDDEGRLLAEYDALSNNLLREYAWLDDTPLAMATGAVASPAWSYIHTGNLGEPVMLTNAAGAMTASVTRDPWGNPILIAGTNPLALGYPGQWKDLAGGLWHNHNRDYDPTLGRYTEADPIGLAGGANVYGYVGGNPVNWVDPEGLESATYDSNGRWRAPMRSDANPFGDLIDFFAGDIIEAFSDPSVTTIGVAIICNTPIGRGAKFAKGLITPKKGYGDTCIIP